MRYRNGRILTYLLTYLLTEMLRCQLPSQVGGAIPSGAMRRWAEGGTGAAARPGQAGSGLDGWPTVRT